MHFAIMTKEVKTGTMGLDIADNQNTQSLAVAVRTVVNCSSLWVAKENCIERLLPSQYPTIPIQYGATHTMLSLMETRSLFGITHQINFILTRPQCGDHGLLQRMSMKYSLLYIFGGYVPLLMTFRLSVSSETRR